MHTPLAAPLLWQGKVSDCQSGRETVGVIDRKWAWPIVQYKYLQMTLVAQGVLGMFSWDGRMTYLKMPPHLVTATITLYGHM